MNSVRLLLRWALAAVFIAAAIPKIASPGDFALAVFRYHLVPHPVINLFALTLPWLELLSALALLALPRYRAAAWWMLVAMLIVFSAAIAINLARGIDTACGCFSVKPGARHMGMWNLLRNAGLLVIAMLARPAEPSDVTSAAPPGR